VAVAAVLSAEQLATLLETNTSAFIRLDRDWVLTYVNAQAEILLQRPRQRLALVAEITRIMVGSRDVEAVAAMLAKAVVPQLATWSMVSLYDDEGRLYESTPVHRQRGTSTQRR
jgi:PAS domain-containing protein